MVQIANENKTAYAILGLLNHEPLSGYDIRKRIDGSIGLFWDAGFGQIYPALKKLADKGLVEGKAEKSGGRPDKKIYRITEKGRKELEKWLVEPTAKEHVRYEILLKLFFGSLVDTERNIETIKEFRARYTGLLETLEGYERNLRLVLPKSQDHLYYLLTVRFGSHIYRAYLNWADEALEMLRNKATVPGDN